MKGFFKNCEEFYKLENNVMLAQALNNIFGGI